MKVVGNCPKCGNPIYGQRMLAENEQPTIKRSCACVIVTMAAPRTVINKPPWQSPLPPFHIGGGSISSSAPWQQAWNMPHAVSTYLHTIIPPIEPDSDAGMVT